MLRDPPSLPSRADANRDAIASVPGVIEAIVGAMRRCESEVDVQASACCLLHKLAVDGAYRRVPQHVRQACAACMDPPFR